MTSYLMTWKESGWPHSNIVQMVNRFKRDGYVDEPWRVFSHKKIKRKDGIWLLRQGKGLRGIFGFGSVIGDPYRGERGDGEIGWLVRVRFTKFNDPEIGYLIEANTVRRILPEVQALN